MARNWNVGCRSAMTLVEILIAALLLSGFLGTIIYIQRFTMNSYRITSWKQEKTRQIETFWNQFRKPIEEVSDALSRNPPAGSDWEVIRTPRPLRYRSRSAGNEGVVMVWRADHLTSSGDLEYSREYKLELKSRRLEMTGVQFGTDQTRLLVEGVDEVRVRSTSIRQAQNPAVPDERFEEYLDPSGAGSADPIVGSVVELSITVSPDRGSGIPNQRIVQNAKFKIPVESREDLSL
ncbi:MAG TPA: hypothetical protein PKM25_09985 [Candidatus Ozemobacteraceae bacterium]|nr:hypothetical protein [Candidatus Ozemobacteraceae bacterium]